MYRICVHIIHTHFDFFYVSAWTAAGDEDATVTTSSGISQEAQSPIRGKPTLPAQPDVRCLVANQQLEVLGVLQALSCDNMLKHPTTCSEYVSKKVMGLTLTMFA